MWSVHGKIGHTFDRKKKQVTPLVLKYVPKVPYIDMSFVKYLEFLDHFAPNKQPINSC